MKKAGLALALAALPAMPALAGDPVIEQVEASRAGGTWTFHVTVSHPDTGWEHYADGWSILAEDGTELWHRELLHPHVDEQPFRRSLSGVEIPDGTEIVLVRAHDIVDGWGEAVRVALR